MIAATSTLTNEQRRIVELGDGPAVVIAGAGTGKTRVIVERVRYLLETRDGLLPEQLLVLTYNVKAARELQDRLDQTVGPATRSRMFVSNFHSFCQRILTENAADAGLPPRPDVLDGVGQVLLLKDIRPQLGLVYHGTEWWLGSFDLLDHRQQAHDRKAEAREGRIEHVLLHEWSLAPSGSTEHADEDGRLVDVPLEIDVERAFGLIGAQLLERWSVRTGLVVPSLLTAQS